MNGRRYFAMLAIAVLVASPVEAQSVRVMTFNIRLASAQDGENRWPVRRELLAKVIRDFGPDVLGVQEAQPVQIDYLSKEFPKYTRVGVGREADGGGEYSAIYFRSGRFDLSDAGTRWLSDAPDTPGSRTWKNSLPRIYTWARLLDRRTKRRFTVLNTHWDHESQLARLNSGKMMAEHVERILSDSDEPVIVMGDFNSGIENPATHALIREGALMTDTLLKLKPDEKDLSTFNGFGRLPNSPKIDAIFTTRHWKVEDAEIVRTNDHGRYPSDHFPVTATISLGDSPQKH
jgi:endonuclease/exonuclease/phosphatase family metal-dependent hydrolase